jgi:hypothetical protein
MKWKCALPFWLCLLSGCVWPVYSQEIMSTVITCCDEQKIRQAMIEEALVRIAATAAPGFREREADNDYISQQACKKIRKRLPLGANQIQVKSWLREWLVQPAAAADVKEFQTLVGYFVTGMTLEIGNTLQDEFDQAVNSKEKLEKLLGELEKYPSPSGENLDQALFQAGLSARELRRILALERKWKNAAAGASPFVEFNTLKMNISGRAPDPDQRMAFRMAEVYNPRFPFLDEFLGNYRHLAADFLVMARHLHDRLSGGTE